MKLLGKFKVIKHKANPEVTYPLVRSHNLKSILQEKQLVSLKQYNGKPVYVISLDEKFNSESKLQTRNKI